MKRAELLARLGFSAPEASKIRVIVDTDAKNEADDQYAIAHFLLSPTMDIRAVTAAHFEGKAGTGDSMERSFREIQKVLELMEIEDVPALRGQKDPGDMSLSDAVHFIIEEAQKDDPRPLYVAVLGAATNLAAALRAAPEMCVIRSPEKFFLYYSISLVSFQVCKEINEGSFFINATRGLCCGDGSARRCTSAFNAFLAKSSVCPRRVLFPKNTSSFFGDPV